MDLLKLKHDRDFFKTNKDFENALNISNKIWEIEKSDWNLYFLIQFLRKTRRFNDARSILNTYKIHFSSFKLLENEELWLDYSEKIYNWTNNPNFLEDAQHLLKRAPTNNKYTKEIYIRTQLNIIAYYLHKEDFEKTLETIETLDYNILSNKSKSFNQYSSQLKFYFQSLSTALIKLKIIEDYLKKLLDKLNFSSIKTSEYINEILKNKEDESIKAILTSNLKSLKDEVIFRERKLFRFNYIANKVTTISDLSDFTFCPVAFAINSSYDVIPNRSLNIENYTDQKWTLGVRYFEYQKNQNFNHTFYDFESNLDGFTRNSFMEIFSSILLFNSYQNLNNKLFFRNSDDTLRGIPDYVFQNNSGQKFVVIEKFTKRKSDNEDFFINDKMKLLANMFESNSLNVDFGYLIYWKYTLTADESTGQPIQKVNGCNIIKIYKNEEDYNLLKRIIYDLKTFKHKKQFHIENNQITLSKCLRCSVKHYCNHKTGKFNKVELPYNIEV